MDKKLIVISLLGVSIPLVILIFSLILSNNDLSPLTNLEICNTLEYNSISATNLVFFAEKEQAETYKNFFQETSPFDKNKEAFNFYYIDSYIPECELYKEIAILCHSKELIKKGTSCPNDYLIVLSSYPSNIRSSAYENVLSVNINHPQTVLTHEFGHAFANLAEEYTPAKLSKGSRNCVDSCNDFSYETDGCFEGCSQNNYQRSISNGVMRTLSSNEYGMLNEKLILEKIKKEFSSLTGNVVLNQEQCSTQDYYLIEGKYDQNSISLIDKSIEQGCLGNNGAGNFIYSIKTTSGELISESEFNPELIFTDAPGENQIDGETFVSDKNFLLKIQKISQAKSLTISENNQELIEINLLDIGARACKI